jgi:hypothetical protein
MDIKIKKGKIYFKSFSFLREIAAIKRENLKIDKNRRIDVDKMQRRFEI